MTRPTTDRLAAGFGDAGPGDLRMAISDFGMAIMITRRRIPEKFGRRSSDRPTIFDLVNTDHFYVDKINRISQSGFVPHAGRDKPAFVGLRHGKAGHQPGAGVRAGATGWRPIGGTNLKFE